MDTFPSEYTWIHFLTYGQGGSTLSDPKDKILRETCVRNLNITIPLVGLELLSSFFTDHFQKHSSTNLKSFESVPA